MSFSAFFWHFVQLPSILLIYCSHLPKIRYYDSDTAKKPKGVIDLRFCRVSLPKTGEEDRFTIQAPVWQKVCSNPNTAADRRDWDVNFIEDTERVYEIRAPSKDLALMWTKQIDLRRNPTVFFVRAAADYDAFIAWISNEGNAGKAVPEEAFKRSCQYIWDNAADFLCYKEQVQYFGPNYRAAHQVLFYKDNYGNVWDSRCKNYTNEYFAVYGIMPPTDAADDDQLNFHHRPYPKTDYEPDGEFYRSSEFHVYRGAYNYGNTTTEQWLKDFEWPLAREERRQAKRAKGVPLDEDDMTPPPSPRRDDDDYGGGYGGSSSSTYDDYDTPSSFGDVPETAYVAPVGMSAEERREKELAHKIDQWQRQCHQINSANSSMKEKYERAMNDFQRKHKEWQDTTKVTCSSCKGSTKKDCGQCKGTGRGNTGKECLTCRGRAKQDCLHCSSHKGLEYGPKGKYAEPKPPSAPSYKSLPPKPS